MQRGIIVNAMFKVANNEPTANLSPLALVLIQVTAYAQYRMLKRHKLVNLRQSKDFIRTLHMPTGSL